jgi:hypothetical protein
MPSCLAPLREQGSVAEHMLELRCFAKGCYLLFLPSPPCRPPPVLLHAQELEVAELRRRLKAEHGVRKACERWLKSELTSRVSGYFASSLASSSALMHSNPRSMWKRAVQAAQTRGLQQDSAACTCVKLQHVPCTGGPWGLSKPCLRHHRGCHAANPCMHMSRKE